MSYCLALFGLPTAGKSTLSYLCSQHLKIKQINLGHILRTSMIDEIEGSSSIDTGLMIDDDTVARVVEKLLMTAENKGYVLDGFPRTLNQLKHFFNTPFSGNCQFLFLDIDLDLVHERFLRRLNCLSCKKAYYPKQSMSFCPDCGDKLIRRPDQTPEALENKLRIFWESEWLVVQELTSLSRCKRVNILGEVEHDLAKLLEAIRI